jgi:predicted porin
MKFRLSSAAALVMFAGAAYAQSSVTLYGVLDTGLLYQSTSAASFQPHALNLGHVYQLKDGGIYASYWGLKGSEDIGGGYRSELRTRCLRVCDAVVDA